MTDRQLFNFTHLLYLIKHFFIKVEKYEKRKRIERTKPAVVKERRK